MRTNVTRQFRSRGRNVHTFVRGNELLLCGRFVPGNESASNIRSHELSSRYTHPGQSAQFAGVRQ